MSDNNNIESENISTNHYNTEFRESEKDDKVNTNNDDKDTSSSNNNQGNLETSTSGSTNQTEEDQYAHDFDNLEKMILSTGIRVGYSCQNKIYDTVYS